MGKNLKNQTGFTKAASDSTPSGTKTMDPAPGGSMIRNIKGPSIHNKPDAGDMKNGNGVDRGTTVESE